MNSSTEIVVQDSVIVEESILGWPVGSYNDIRVGCIVLDFGSCVPSWTNICNFLSECPPLHEIETFWVDGHLLITGMPEVISKDFQEVTLEEFHDNLAAAQAHDRRYRG